MDLFSIQFVGSPRRDMTIDISGSLRDVQSGEELRIPVRLRDLPDSGEITIQIKMQSLLSGRSSFQVAKWSQISGSPYVLHGGVSGTKSTISNRQSK